MYAPRIASLVVALVLTAQAVLFAQQEPPVAPGDRVRVSAATAHLYREVCTVLELRPDTLVVDRDGSLALPLASVTRLEVSRGKKSNVGRGALVSGLAGAAVGGIVAGYACSAVEFPFETEPSCSTGGVVQGAAVGAAVGTGIGALIGAVSKTDRWEEIPPDRLHVTVLPQRRGLFLVGVSVHF